MDADVTLRCVDRLPGPPRARRMALLTALATLACSERTIEAYPDQLAGVGIVVKSNGSAFVIGSIVDGGPASEAGLKSGDAILEVNGKPTEGQSLASVVDSLRGHDGSDVVVRIQSAGATEVHTLKRRRLARNGDAYRATP